MTAKRKSWQRFIPKMISANFSLMYNVESKVKSKVKTVDSIKTLMESEPTITIPEIAVALGMSIGGIEKAIRKMKSEGLIERVASKKGGHWRVIK